MILKKGEVDKIWPDSFTNSWREWVWTILLLFIQMWSHSWISRRAMRKWWTTTGGGEKKSQYINLKFYLNFVPFPFNILLTWQQIHWISTSNWNYYYESFWTPPPPSPLFPFYPVVQLITDAISTTDRHLSISETQGKSFSTDRE